MELDKTELPIHVGIIMDGNGRWAKKRGLPRQFGHRQGAKTFRKIVRHCKSIGIKYVTFYAFSTENWKRPTDEVASIMQLMREYLDDVRGYIDENVRLVFIGDRSALDVDIRQKMFDLERDSESFTAMTLAIALNYGGRAEITHAVSTIADDICAGKLSAKDVTQELLASRLYTSSFGMPDVDLIIRPSGEYRLSNFLIWQAAYAEYVFMNILWPDFSEKDMDAALVEYASRNRRFGGV